MSFSGYLLVGTAVLAGLALALLYGRSWSAVARAFVGAAHVGARPTPGSADRQAWPRAEARATQPACHQAAGEVSGSPG